ncbi:MAG: HNH endonuclease [Sedimentisphaerales bacterium]|nr:HNH endonuclease [Sedimentisphaerales bacterium]
MVKYKALKVNGIKVDEHRYVMQQFLGRPLLRTEIVHHKDGNPRNNSIDNLRLMSPQEHARHHLTGRHTCPLSKQELQSLGRRHRTSAKLEASDIPVIRKMISRGIEQQFIASIYGVHRTQISRIKKGITWSWVP